MRKGKRGKEGRGKGRKEGGERTFKRATRVHVPTTVVDIAFPAKSCFCLCDSLKGKKRKEKNKEKEGGD